MFPKCIKSSRKIICISMKMLCNRVQDRRWFCFQKTPYQIKNPLYEAKAERICVSQSAVKHSLTRQKRS